MGSQLPSVGCFQGRAGQVSSWQCSHREQRLPSSASTLKLHLWVKSLLDQTTFLLLFEQPPEGRKFHRVMEKKRFIFFPELLNSPWRDAIFTAHFKAWVFQTITDPEPGLRTRMGAAVVLWGSLTWDPSHIHQRAERLQDKNIPIFQIPPICK